MRQTREPPPCLSCFDHSLNGPRFEAEFKTVLGKDEDGYFELYQTLEQQPCAWIHRSCLIAFFHDHAEPTATGEIIPKRVCLVCAVDVRADELLPLNGRPDSGPPP